MTLHAVRRGGTAPLWQAFLDGFLGEVGDHTGPAGYPSFAWFTHRLQRDRLWREAAARGLKGWLNPPHSFFSELPRRFGIDLRPIGLLERQSLLDRLSAEAGARTGFTLAVNAPLGRGIDQVLGELLPEGISAEQLAEALARLPGADDFSRARSNWLVEVYRGYLAALSERKQHDHRSVHALLAQRIIAGGLKAAIGGAGRLHLYGLSTNRHRLHLLDALANAPDVGVLVYSLDNAAADLRLLPCSRPRTSSASWSSSPSRSSGWLPNGTSLSTTSR